MNDDSILDDCLESLSRHTGLIAGRESSRSALPGSDGLITIEGPLGDVVFEVVIKAHLSLPSIERLHASTTVDQARRILIATDHVSRGSGNRLRDLGVCYLDRGGNAFIRGDGIHVRIDGLPRVAGAPGRPVRAALARTTGVQVVRALLIEPDLIDTTTREIATAALVSQPSVTRVLNELADEGLIRIAGRRRACSRYPELHERWIRGYLDVLRPKLRPIRVTPLQGTTAEVQQRVMEQQADSLSPRCGGGAVASAYGADLRDESLVLHVHKSQRRSLRAEYGLKQDPDGPITLLDLAGRSPVTGGGVAAPLDVHAELSRHGDTRALAAAEAIYERHLLPCWSAS